ncbi:helix-turn-helix domain-containing protein [Anaerocolumna sedimenticola]|uniref:Helix-turn-helix domain-containing protein n=1 Tax=Anaerocolumna sedimenticola TaxID=2696063 RepID=A0A6P1TLL5_9FIRM|nr:helix-turn-helix domain-containing protein [Anaerocolumna sedimenticola]QHQ60545.1 helix-turn-helix domain-containing protein [Anaerocolumna sedimenticola]
MNYEHFGVFLRELRLSRNMTREQLAQDICTPKQIYRIEKGVYEPSLYLINQLSIKFNMDLNEYFKMYFTSNTIAGLEGINSINAAIEREDIQVIKSTIDKYEKMEDFKKGENLQHIYYGKALCSAIIDNDFNTSLDYCFKGIRIEYPEFNMNNISKTMYSNIGISILNCIAQNYFAMEQHDKGMKVLTELLAVLEAFVINSPYPLFQASQFSQKIYQGVLYNVSVHLFDHGDIKEALTYVEKGIAFSLKVYNIRHLPNLIFMKFKILYCEQKYEEAREYYNRAVNLYKITNKEALLGELEDTAKTEYPEIFKEKYT